MATPTRNPSGSRGGKRHGKGKRVRSPSPGDSGDDTDRPRKGIKLRASDLTPRTLKYAEKAKRFYVKEVANVSPYPGALNRADQVGKVMKAVALDPKATPAELATFLRLTQDEPDKYEKARTYVSVLVVSG